MTDLNLNFDTGIKSVTMGPTSNDNISVNNQNNSTSEPNSPNISSGNSQNNSAPSLSVSDPVGIEFLAKGSNLPKSTNDNSPKSTKSEEFNFFKPSEPEPDKKTVDTSNDDMIANPKQNDNSEFKPIHRLTPQDIKNEKIDLLYKFKKLESQGIRTTMNYNMNSHLEDMRNEYIKLKKQREIDNSVKFQRKILMAFVTGLEFLNNKVDPFAVQLDGWSESVNENINDFDEVFEELSEKYGGKSEIAPELKLLMMLGGSAFMFHLTNTMFKSSIPGMDDIMKQNPDLMKQFAQAAVGSIGKQNEGPPPMRETMPQPQPQPRANDIRQQSSAPDMEGPSGLDDIINQMNLQPGDIPDLDSISLMSGDTDKKSIGSGGMTLNL